MSFFSFTKPHEEISLVFDIGSDSVGGTITKLSKHSLPIVIYSYREPISFNSEASYEKLLALALQTLRHVVQMIAQEGLTHSYFAKHGSHRVRHIFCTFSAPWYIAHTKTIVINRDEQFVVTEKLIGEILEKDEDDFEKSIKDGDYSKIFKQEVEAIERKIIETRLNGYSVNAPYSKKARNLEVSLYTSIVPKELLNMVREIMRSHFHFNVLEFSSAALGIFTMVRDLYPAEENFLIVTIAGEVTEVSVVSKGMLGDTISFPGGRMTLIRTLSRVLKITSEVGLSYIKLYGEQAIEKRFTQKIEKAVLEFSGMWCSTFARAIEDLAKNNVLSKKIFLTVAGDVALSFQRLIEKERCIQFPLSPSGDENDMYTVTVLGAPVATHVVQAEKNVKNDVSLFLQSAYAAKLFNLET